MTLRRFFIYNEEHPSDFICGSMTVFSLILTLFGLFYDGPVAAFQGVARICVTSSALVTDSIVVGGMGAAFLNAGLVSLVSIALLRINKLAFSGISVACLFLMSGFAFFGKDILNIVPILVGTYLYSLYKHERFARYLYTSLFGTALSPVVTEFALYAQNSFIRYLLTLCLGALIGFLLPSIASHTLRIHQGYNLYNVGFAAGLSGMVIASLAKSMGFVFAERMLWSTGNNVLLGCFFGLLFLGMIATGFVCNKNSFRGYSHITRHSGRAMADFVVLDNYALSIINMGIVGMMAMLYVIVVGGPINGPTIGGILTVCGFGAFGKHPRNIIAPVLGVVIPSFFAVWNLTDPSVLLAALFATALAPIAGQFGWRWGIVAGLIHSSVVLNVSTLHGGLNLYNNGFSAGLVCIVLLPLIEGLRYGKES